MKPRVLADDLLIIATGARHLEHIEYAFNLTHKHLHDIGAKVAPKKRLTFSSDPAARKWLKDHTWRRIRKTIKVATDTRDLGAHLNTAQGRMRGTTLTSRMRTTTRATIRLGRIKAPYERKTEIIRAKMLPKGLYGCETTLVNDAELRS